MTVDAVIVNWNGGLELLGAVESAGRWPRARGALRYSRRHFGPVAAVSVAAAVPAAFAIGVAVDIAHWLARRP